MLIPYSECVKRYGNHHKIARMVETGELFKIEPGIYSDTKRKPRELELIQARYPAASRSVRGRSRGSSSSSTK